MLAKLRLISIKLIFCFLFLSVHQKLSSFVLRLCWPCEGWAARRGGHSPALLLQHGESRGLGAAQQLLPAAGRGRKNVPGYKDSLR